MFLNNICDEVETLMIRSRMRYGNESMRTLLRIRIRKYNANNFNRSQGSNSKIKIKH